MDFLTLDRTLYFELGGTLASPAGKPLLGAKVVIDHQFLGHVATVGTGDGNGHGEAGRWSKPDLAVPGRYRLLVTDGSGRYGLTPWFEADASWRPREMRVELTDANGESAFAGTPRANPTDLFLEVVAGHLVGEGLIDGRLFEVACPGLYSTPVDAAAAAEAAGAIGVNAVRGVSTYAPAAALVSAAEAFIDPNDDGQLPWWREQRDAVFGAFAAAGIRAGMDLFDDPERPASAPPPFSVMQAPARARLNTWRGEVPSFPVVEAQVPRFLDRIPRALRRGLLIGPSHCPDAAGWREQWAVPFVTLLDRCGIRTPVQLVTEAGRAGSYPEVHGILVVAVDDRFLEDGLMPLDAHRDFVDWAGMVRGCNPHAHVVISTAGLRHQRIREFPELIRRAWEEGFSIRIGTANTPDRWTADERRALEAAAAVMGIR